MEDFHFRLEKVLGWQRTQADLEEARTKQCLAALAGLQAARARVQNSRLEAGRQVLAATVLHPQDLAALAEFRRSLTVQDRELRGQEEDSEQRLAEQRRRWTEARRRCRLLEKLKNRRLAEYRLQADRELETLAMESFTAGWSRKQRGPDPWSGEPE